MTNINECLPEILELDNFLTNIFGQNNKIVNAKISRLNAAGDNYASLILALDITLKKENVEKNSYLVAKILPPNDFMRKFMNIQFTVRNELGFYQTIIPTLKAFQKERTGKESLDFFPKFYGGRLNLNSSEQPVDDNSIIVLENLKKEGYFLYDKNIGFDLESTKLMLAKMAELHGSVIALKETQPKIFDEKLLPFFKEFHIFQMDNGEEFMSSSTVIEAITSIFKEDKFCASNFDRIQKSIKSCVEGLKLPKNSSEFAQDVFASLIHDDLWVNNIMVKTKMNKITDVKFFDWQLYEYASVTRDILFFLCSSASDEVFATQFDYLMSFYYESLIDILKKLKCNVTKFTVAAFENELKTATNQVTFFYILGAIPSIFPSDDKVYEVDELSAEKLLAQVRVSDICRKRIYLMTRTFIQKGWI